MVGSSSALTAVTLVASPSSGCGVAALEEGLALRLGSTATTTPNWRGVGEARTSRTASTMSLGTAYLRGARGTGRGARSEQCVVGGESSVGPDEGGGGERGEWGVCGAHAIAHQSRSSSSMTCTAASLMARSPVEAGPL